MDSVPRFILLNGEAYHHGRSFLTSIGYTDGDASKASRDALNAVLQRVPQEEKLSPAAWWSDARGQFSSKW